MIFKKNESDIAETEHETRVPKYGEKKIESIIRTYRQPILPRLCRMILWMMIVIVAVMLLVDIVVYIRYGAHLGTGHLFINVCITGFWGWMLFSAFLVPMCFLGMKQGKNNYMRRKKKSGIIDASKEEKERTQRAIKRLNYSFLLYIKVAFAGAVVWSVLYLICCFAARTSGRS